MNNFFNGFMGYSVLKIRGAAPASALNALVKAGIAFWNVEWIDVLTLQITVFSKTVHNAEKAITSAMCDVEQLRDVRLKQHFGHFLDRRMLVLFLCICIIVSIMLPRYVLFYEVIGNEKIPSEQILRELYKTGVGFGTYGPSIRPHWVKNRLLYQLPDLQWVTITQNGCRASVIVRERNKTPVTETKKGYANVIATQSGIITKQSVMAGQAQFKVGDTVQKGDVLVSGIVDLERIYVIENAKAEIFARTWRKKQVCTPVSCAGKSMCDIEKHCVWLIFGDKRIKIFGNSGISHSSCDKMITKLDLALPDGLCLPLSIQIETFSLYREQVRILNALSAEKMLETYIISETTGDMQAGEILQSQSHFRQINGLYTLNETLECHEMIAETIPAKWKNEELLHDGTYGQCRENGADH